LVPNKAPSDAELVGGRYRLTAKLGSGGTAEVFRAHDELLERDVAVKLFRTTPTGEDDLHTAERRDVELQSLVRLSHPNLIRLLDGSLGPEEPAYLVLDLVCGPDLATRLHDGPLPEAEVRVIGRQIADALDYAHGLGMVHRDVKPANILLGDDGPDGGVWARLSDFGTVRMIDGARLTAADLTVGTVSYIAPEQAHGADVGPAADVYSLGLVLIEALTGQRCFPGTTPEALDARLASTPAIPDWLPADLVALLTAMTAPDADQRPTAAAVAESLLASVPPGVAAAADAEATTALRSVAAAPASVPAAFAADAPSEPVVLAAEEPPTRARSRVGLLFAIAGLACAGLVAAVAMALTGGSAPSGGDAPVVGPQPSGSTGHSTGHHLRTTGAGVHQVIQPSGPANSNGPTHPRASLSTAARTPTTAPAQHNPTPVTSSTSSSAAGTSSTAAPTTSASSSTSAVPSTSTVSSTVASGAATP
jgi:eukaryotic-like serine/threonine-protein kinase